jgi:hypothetical protein
LAHLADEPVLYRHRALDIDLSAIDDVRMGPQEVGGVAVPTFPYKAGQMAAGGFTAFPRLSNYFGWLLYAALGHKASSTARVDPATMFDHLFMINPGAGLSTKIPWMTFYKYIPGDQDTLDPTLTDLYEVYEDCKVLGMNFITPNDGPVSARIDVLGRKWNLSDTAPLEYTNTMEGYKSIPVGCRTGGYIKIPSYSGDKLPVVQAQVGITNTPLDIRQEKVIGDPDLDTVTITSRQLTIDLVVKWKDPTLYRKLYTGAVDGTAWNAAPFVEEFETYSVSADYATGETPWDLKIYSPAMLFQINGGIRMAGPNAVMVRLTGQAIEPDNGEDYVEVTLGNLQEDYVWPEVVAAP